MFLIKINQYKKTNGVTLVELMIAMAISAILMLGISQIFQINQRSFKTGDDSARMQESGRFAFNLLMQDLRRAGYFGGNADIANITGTSGIIASTNTCPNDTTWGRMLERRIIGLNDTNAGYPCIANYTQGDIVAMRYTEGANVSALTMAAYPNRFYLRSSMFEGRMFIGSAEANASNQVSETPNSVHELSAQAYYIGPSTRTCQFANTPVAIPAMFRQILSNTGVPTSEEVASGIENLQVQYGVDTTGDLAVNQYFNADAISNNTATTPNWDQVVSVQFWVLARAECPTNGYTNSKTYVMGDQNFTFNDSFKRQLFSSTVSVRNGS